MPGHIRLQPYLTEHELRERYQLADDHDDRVERSRWQLLWLFTRGLTATAIARVMGYFAYWIGRIARRYNAAEPGAVCDGRRRPLI